MQEGDAYAAFLGFGEASPPRATHDPALSEDFLWERLIAEFAEQNRVLEDECCRLEGGWERFQAGGCTSALNLEPEEWAVQAPPRDELRELLAEVDAWRGLHALEAEEASRLRTEVNGEAEAETWSRSHDADSSTSKPGSSAVDGEMLELLGKARVWVQEGTAMTFVLEEEMENNIQEAFHLQELHADEVEQTSCKESEQVGALVRQVECLEEEKSCSGCQSAALRREASALSEEIERLQARRGEELRRHEAAFIAVEEERSRLADEVEIIRGGEAFALEKAEQYHLEAEREAGASDATSAEQAAALSEEADRWREAHGEGLRGREADAREAEERESELRGEIEALRSEHARAKDKAHELRRRSSARAESAEEARGEAADALAQVARLEGRLERWKRKHADEVERREAAEEHAAEAQRIQELLREEVECGKCETAEQVSGISNEVESLQAAKGQKERRSTLPDGHAKDSSGHEAALVLAEEEHSRLVGEVESLRDEHGFALRNFEEESHEELQHVRRARDEAEESRSAAAVAREQASKLEGRLDRWKRKHADEAERREAADEQAAKARRELETHVEEVRHLSARSGEHESAFAALTAEMGQLQEDKRKAELAVLPTAEEVAALSEEVKLWQEARAEEPEEVLAAGGEQCLELEVEVRRLLAECAEEAEEVAAADEEATKLEMRMERWKRRHSAEVERREAAVQDMDKAEQTMLLHMEETEEAAALAVEEERRQRAELVEELQRQQTAWTEAAAERAELEAAQGIERTGQEVITLAALVDELRESHAKEVERRELAAAEAADAAEAQALDLRAGAEEWRRMYLESREEDASSKTGNQRAEALAACRWRCLAEALLREEFAEAAGQSRARAAALAACRWGRLAERLLRAGVRGAPRATALAACRWVRLAELLWHCLRTQVFQSEMDAFKREHDTPLRALRCELADVGAQRDLGARRLGALEAVAARSAATDERRTSEVEGIIAAREQAFVLVGQLQDEVQEERSELQGALQLWAEESSEVQGLQELQLETQVEARELGCALEASREEARELQKALEELWRSVEKGGRPIGSRREGTDLGDPAATARGSRPSFPPEDAAAVPRGHPNPFATPRGPESSVASARGSVDGSETDGTTPRGAETAGSSGGEATGSSTPRTSTSLTRGDALRAGPRARLAFRREARGAR